MSTSILANTPAKLGIALLVVSGLIFLNLFGRPLAEEVKYQLTPLVVAPPPLTSVDTDFSITIPTLGASSRIIADVSPTDSKEYQRALSLGVAQASGTKLPGEGGNIFLFAHSSADLWQAARFNSVFYLMHHLVPGDIINIWYQNKEFQYEVTAKKIVAPSETEYLSESKSTETLTLMTCYPPGTTLKRLLVIAKLRQ